MPIENNKPPDPLVEEFCELTGMSSDKVHLSRSSVSLSKMKEGKARRHRHGIKIKVASPGSASIGAGKSRKRIESCPMDNRGRNVFTHLNCLT
jgi:hypothetical protein